MIPLRAAWTGLGLIMWAIVVAFWAEFPAQRGLAVDPVRLLVVGGFLVVGPGLALTGLLRLRDRLLSWVTAMAVSLAVLTLGAQAARYLARWSPVGVVRVIAMGTAGLALAGVVQGFREFRRMPAGKEQDA